MAERERLVPRRVHEPTEWHMSSSSFWIAFIVIAAGITIAALLLR